MEARLDAQHQMVMRDGAVDNEDKVKAMQAEFKVSTTKRNILLLSARHVQLKFRLLLLLR